MALLALAELATTPVMRFLVLDSVEELKAEVAVSPDGSLAVTETRRGIRLFDAVEKEAPNDLFEWIRARYPFAQICVVLGQKMYRLQESADRHYRKHYREFKTQQNALAPSPHTTESALSLSGSTSSLDGLIDALPNSNELVEAPRVPYSMRRPRQSTQKV